VANPKSDIKDDVGRSRFTAIAKQVVEAMGAPDILALQEIQDDDGAEMGGDRWSITPVGVLRSGSPLSS
jgi:hypothetical protein